MKANKGLLLAGAGILGLMFFSGSSAKQTTSGGGSGGGSLIALPTGFASGGSDYASSPIYQLPAVNIVESAEIMPQMTAENIPAGETKKSASSGSSKSSSVVLSNFGSKALSSPISNPLSYSKTSAAISSLDTKKSENTKQLESVANKTAVGKTIGIASNIVKGVGSLFSKKK